MTNEEHRNWVKARADCTLEGTFEDLIKVIKQDVKCFNELPDAKRSRKEPVTHWDRDDGSFFVGFGTPRRIVNDDHVQIYIVDKELRVLCWDDLMFKVESKWNKQTLTCDLLIDETPHSLWEISQRAIYDLLFPEE